MRIDGEMGLIVQIGKNKKILLFSIYTVIHFFLKKRHKFVRFKEASCMHKSTLDIPNRTKRIPKLLTLSTREDVYQNLLLFISVLYVFKG